MHARRRRKAQLTGTQAGCQRLLEPVTRQTAMMQSSKQACRTGGRERPPVGTYIQDHERRVGADRLSLVVERVPGAQEAAAPQHTRWSARAHGQGRPGK